MTYGSRANGGMKDLVQLRFEHSKDSVTRFFDLGVSFFVVDISGTQKEGPCESPWGEVEA